MERTSHPLEEKRIQKERERALRRTRKSVERYLMERGADAGCSVDVRRMGDCYELFGTVDSFWAKAVLFSMIPFEDGRKRIVDRLEISDETIVYGA